jgi:hypothetical protein
VREQRDVGVAEMGAAGENAAEQDGGIDGGDFGVPDAPASVDIGEVIEEAAMVRQFVTQELQRGDHALAGFRAGYKAAQVSNAKCSQTESSGGNAGYGGIVGGSFARVATVFDQPSFRAGLLPEKAATEAFNVVEELVVFRGKGLGWRLSGIWRRH